MITFQQLLDEDEGKVHPQYEAWNMELAWMRWVDYSCVERHGRHFWTLVLEYGSINAIRCSACNTFWELHFPELQELLYAELPVEIDVDHHVYPAGPWGPAEYDTYVNASGRAPQAWEDE